MVCVYIYTAVLFIRQGNPSPKSVPLLNYDRTQPPLASHAPVN
jgi:hypothetical protein